MSDTECRYCGFEPMFHDSSKCHVKKSDHIIKIEKENKLLKIDRKSLLDFTEEVTNRINPNDENMARFYYYGLTVMKGLKTNSIGGTA